MKNKKTEKEILPPCVIRRKSSIYTVSESGNQVYGEKIIPLDGKYLRQWNPRRSKLGSSLSNGNFPLKIERKWNVLYLGASTGTTVSHLSDIVTDGSIYAVEFAPEPFKKLLLLSEERNNIFPILEDSRNPEKYSFFIDRKIDLIYQDISQRDQLDIFKRNIEFFPDWQQAILVLKLR
ncbi:MAG: fibrillarin-like rRNA/tRNA 2'-O-methyltransferase, partial [Thermoplasmataceae archaeon]